MPLAIAFEEGHKRQKTIGQPSTSTKVKEERVFVVSGQGDKRECWRCGAGNFTAAHLKICKAPGTHCNYCGIKGHFKKCCNSKQKDKFKKIAIPKNFHRNYYEGDEDSDSDEMVLNVEGEGTQKTTPYYLEGWINGFRFKTMIDTGSPVTIFAVDEKRASCVEKISNLDEWLKEKSMYISTANPIISLAMCSASYKSVKSS